MQLLGFQAIERRFTDRTNLGVVKGVWHHAARCSFLSSILALFLFASSAWTASDSEERSPNGEGCISAYLAPKRGRQG